MKLLLKLVALVLVVYGTFTLVTMHGDISNLEDRAAQLTAGISSTESENARLQNSIETATTDEGKAAIARSELGLVAPGEIVFKEMGN